MQPVTGGESYVVTKSCNINMFCPILFYSVHVAALVVDVPDNDSQCKG